MNDPYEVLMVTGIEPTFLTQTIQHDPDEDVGGDCYRTALACLLGWNDPLSVPHFCAEAADDWAWFVASRTWMRDTQDLDLAAVVLADAQAAGVPCIANVRSKRGSWNHAVVVHGDQMHDPSGLGGYTLADIAEDTVEVVSRRYDPDPATLIAQWLANATVGSASTEAETP